MNTLRNQIQLIGNVGQDPEIVLLENGRKMARFSMATNDVYTNDQGEKVEKTYWHHVIFFNRTAETVEQHVTKGSRLGIQGKLTSRSWEDEAGMKHYRTEIIGRELLLL